MARIAIDIHAVGARLTGNETYIANLVTALAWMPGDESYLLYYRAPAGAVLARRPRMQARPLGFFGYHPIPRLLLSFGRKLKRDGADLLHVQYVGPLAAPCPMIVMIHDLAFLHFPEAFRWDERLWMRLLIPRAAHRAAHVLTGSEFSRQDLIARYGLPPTKVTVTPYGVSSLYRPLRDRSLVRAVQTRYRLPEHFILAVGNIQPRKNLRRLVEAWSRARQAGTIDAGLVIAGQESWGAGETVQAAREVNLMDEIRFTGYVPVTDLPLLYNAADLFVYPSLFEGFGLPLLEAMACGTPVVAGANSAIPEVVGDAALLTDTADVAALQAILEQVLRDRHLRECLGAAGRRRARQFTWRYCALKTLEIYRTVLDRRETGE
ncbi:MAG: glycosyltransferase family 4 protein [Ardenticatenaceae bacterium]|nr:glycosyltransferase family 4 protein [Ardenticatenaceae bacterium]